MAAAGGGKIKFRGKCESAEGGGDPVEETRRLKQKEDPRVRGKARRWGAEVSSSEGKWEEERREKRGRVDPKEKPEAHSGRLVGEETFISRTLRKADEWWRNGGAATPVGRASAQPAAPAPRPVGPEHARTPCPPLPGPARARRWHEIGCSCNESAPRGGG